MPDLLIFILGCGITVVTVLAVLSIGAAESTDLPQANRRQPDPAAQGRAETNGQAGAQPTPAPQARPASVS